MRLILVSALMLVFATPAWAEEVPTERVISLAEQGGVNPWDLQGAVNSTQLDPEEYLFIDGKLERPEPEPVAAPPVKVSSVWLRVKQCESPGLGWNANTGNGFYGGLQFDYGSWLKAGGGKYASRADYATPAQQMEIADNWLSMTSWKSWPACSKILGLR